METQGAVDKYFDTASITDFDEFEENDRQGATISRRDILVSLNRNEDGDAWLFRTLNKGKFVYDHSGSRWYRWIGHHWEEDVIDNVTAAIEEVIDLYEQEADRQSRERVKAERSENKDKATLCRQIENDLLRRIRALQSKFRKANVVYLSAVGAGSLGITGQEWDQDPMLLGVKNGVLDLQTGKLRDGHPDDYIKAVVPVEWKGIDESAPVWERVLNDIFDNTEDTNIDLIRFLQRLLGYSITGKVTDHIIPILWGKGRNGKGTLLETLLYVLGNKLAGQVESELFLQQKFMRHSGSPTSDIMNLRGKRLMWASETEEGRKINAGKLKWLCGGDTLTGREPFAKRQVSFYPTHKLMLLTNHLPHANSDDYALWHRILLIPFKISFVDEPRESFERLADPEIINKLKSEASGILSWLVRGCLEWEKIGLNPPEKVRVATSEYRNDEDIIGKFLSEKCTEGSGSEVKAGELYKAYQEWCISNGLKPFSGVNFGKDMKERFDSYKDMHGTHYLGVSL